MISVSHHYKAIGGQCQYTNQLGSTIGRHLEYYLETITNKNTITMGLHKVQLRVLTLGNSYGLMATS